MLQRTWEWSAPKYCLKNIYTMCSIPSVMTMMMIMTMTMDLRNKAVSDFQSVRNCLGDIETFFLKVC